MKDIDDIPVLYSCSRCKKLFEVDKLYKIEKFQFPWKHEKNFSLVCKKCAER